MSEFVMVGCKLPHGLILEIIEPGMMTNSEGKEVAGITPKPPGHRVTIKGACSVYNQRTNKAPSQFAYATTPVDKAFWEAWYKRNKDLDCVKNGLIFVADDSKRAESIAKERVSSVSTGLEPLSGDDDPRMKRSEINSEFSEPRL